MTHSIRIACGNWLAVILTVVAFLSPVLYAQSSRTTVNCDDGFAVYGSSGTALRFEELIVRANQADAVFLGEDHDDRMGHCLQYRIFRALHAAVAPRQMVLSLEMFERDTQTVLDEYQSGLIDERLFLAASRPWKNYAEDYRPLVEYARENEIPVIAANAPRRYVTVIARKGPDALTALSPEAKRWLPPLPLSPPSKAYRERFSQVMQSLNPAGPCATEEELAKAARKPDPHAPEPAAASHANATASARASAMPSWDNLIASQALWDASMAHAVATALKQHPGALVLHLNGGFHTEEGMGILERLPQYREGTKSFVVGLYPRRSFTEFDEDLASAGDAIVQTSCRDYRKKE